MTATFPCNLLMVVSPVNGRSRKRCTSVSSQSRCRDSGFDLVPFDPIGAVIFDFDDHHRTATIDQLGSRPALELEDAFYRRDVFTDDSHFSREFDCPLQVVRVYPNHFVLTCLLRSFDSTIPGGLRRAVLAASYRCWR